MKPPPRDPELSLCRVPDADLLRPFADGDQATFELTATAVARSPRRLV